MTDPWSPHTDQVAVADDEPAAPVAERPAMEDELEVLDALESDLVAVEQAIEQLDRVTAAGLGGEDAVAQIDAAVSAERFGAASGALEPTDASSTRSV